MNRLIHQQRLHKQLRRRLYKHQEPCEKLSKKVGGLTVWSMTPYLLSVAQQLDVLMVSQMETQIQLTQQDTTASFNWNRTGSISLASLLNPGLIQL
jgi:hypothetical protein